MRWLFVFYIFLLLGSCKQQKIVSNYNTPIAEIETYYSIENNTDSSTVISYSISSKDLFVKSSKNSKSYIYFEIEQYDETLNQLIHSYTTRTKIFHVSENSSYIQNSFTIPFGVKQHTSLRIRLLNTQNTLLHSYTYYPSPIKNSLQILQYPNIEIWNQPYVYTDTFAIITKFKHNQFLYYIYKNNKEFEAIVSQKYKAKIDNDTSFVKFSQVGTYTFYTDSLYTDTVFRIPAVSKNFPKNNNPCEMITALQIIFPLLNIDSLSNTKVGCKVELDKIWLQLAKNNEIKAKEAIKMYYTRIEKANKMYSISQAGMYSNRGMCLILLGEPLHIQYNNESEIWYYTADTTIQDKIFTFTKQYSGIQADYILPKISEKTMFFDIAKLNWQNCKAFTLR
ncbi:MAG TPA: GWxTD domain-containing protein [Bacteroidales bacterium]|nr:GWxTD domain-containing protein [Bacteroidales bacterium]